MGLRCSAFGCSRVTMTATIDLVARVRAILTGGIYLSTADLVKRLGADAPKNLQSLAIGELACFARRCQPEKIKRFGKTLTIRRWIWHDYGTPNDEAAKVCPTCKRKL